jgi:hypothetical protein
LLSRRVERVPIAAQRRVQGFWLLRRRPASTIVVTRGHRRRCLELRRVWKMCEQAAGAPRREVRGGVSTSGTGTWDPAREVRDRGRVSLLSSTSSHVTPLTPYCTSDFRESTFPTQAARGNARNLGRRVILLETSTWGRSGYCAVRCSRFEMSGQIERSALQIGE